MDQQYRDDFSDDGKTANGGSARQDLRPKPDGITDPAGEAGWYLERERLSRGLSFEDVALATGIHPYHVEAIEFGDMTRMPPRLEALEMVAAYADFLGFDPEPLLQHYVSFLPMPQVAPRRHPANPAPMMSAKILPFGKFPRIPALNMRSLNLPAMPGGRNGTVASIAAVLLLLTGGSWMMLGPDNAAPEIEMLAESGDPMPTATTGPEAADIQVTDSALPAASDPIELPVASDSDREADQAGDLGAFIAEQVGESDPQPVATTSKPVEIARVDSGGGRIFGDSDPNIRVVLKATKALWLLIEDGQGNRVATQMLNPGDIYRVPNRDGLVAIAQDGGSLVYLVDGVEKGVLGHPGALLAAEPLDAKILEAKG